MQLIAKSVAAINRSSNVVINDHLHEGSSL